MAKPFFLLSTVVSYVSLVGVRVESKSGKWYYYRKPVPVQYN